MKKIVGGFMNKFAILMLVLTALVAFSPRVFAQTEIFEDKNISITSKLPPQWLGWRLHVGSTTQNVPFYYKVSAVVPGIGETVASPVTTAYATYSPLSSTNSLRLMWAPVQTATQYKLYKSVDNSTFNLLTTVSDPVLTYVDEGADVGAAYSAPTPKGGNLTVENDVIVGDDLTVNGSINAVGGMALTSAQTVTGYTVTVSSSATSTLGLCLAGAFQTLPTTGYAEGCIAYQNSDNKVYVATETVAAAGSWAALH